MKNSPSLIIKQLILVGYRKDYIIPFNLGVNIIFGDGTTGKTSVLECINYLFGYKEFNYDEEIESSVKYAALEVEINSVDYVIKRDIYDPKALVEVYRSSYHEVDKIFAEKYEAGFEGSGPYLSDFLFEALNLPNIRVRKAPSQFDTKMIRLSFRDLFKYCYLKQDYVGSERFLDLGNHAVASKNRQTFKYIFNLLDESISNIQEEISECTGEISDLKKKFQSVSEFLRDTQLSSLNEINDQYDDLDRQYDVLSEELEKLNGKMLSDSEASNTLRGIVNDLKMQMRISEEEKNKAEMSIERYSRLKNDYLNDIDEIKAVISSKKSIGEDEVENSICPICDNVFAVPDLTDKFQFTETDRLKHEENFIKRRIRDLSGLISREKGGYKKTSADIHEIKQELKRAMNMLDNETSSFISPYISERDGILSEKVSVKEKRKQLSYALKVRKQQYLLSDKIEDCVKRLSGYQENLKKLQANAPSEQDTLLTLAGLMKQFLSNIKVGDVKEVYIDKTTLLPVFKNKKYEKITSGALKTILSIGHLLNIQRSTINKDVNIPAFLMVDTVGKYIGKTQQKYLSGVDGSASHASDPVKYKYLYESFINASEEFEAEGIPCQFILVDNDVPEMIRNDYAGFIVAEYSSDPRSGLQAGLIDDI